MSPLQSSPSTHPIYTPSSPDNQYSSDKERYTETTTSTAKTKKKHIHQKKSFIQPTNPNNYHPPTAKIKSQNISVETLDGNQYIADSKEFLKKHEQTQPTTHKKTSHKTKKRASSESSNSLVKEPSIHSKKQKPDLDPQAKLILKSLYSCSIKAKDIVESRRKLLQLKVERTKVKKAFYNFKQKIMLSSRTDRQDIIREIERSGKESKSIRVSTKQSTNRLDELLKSASRGTILLKDIKELRKLLFSEYNGEKASSYLFKAKKAILLTRPQETHAIKQAFEKAIQVKHIESQPYKDLRSAIRSENLKVEEFTRLYNAITSPEEKSSLHRKSAIYIHNLSQRIPQFKNKLATVRMLPKHLQTSMATIKSFFPQEHEKMSLIRLGHMKSEKLKETCLELVNVVSITHIRTLLSKYVGNKQTMTIKDKQHMAECRKTLLEMQKSKKDLYDNYIEEIDNNYEESTITSQPTKSTLPTTFKQDKTSIESDEKLILKQELEKANQIKHTLSKQSNYLKTAIEVGGLQVQEFTRLYNAITSAEGRASCHKTIAIYIHHLSQQAQDLQHKLATIKLLPVHLQTSILTLKSFFPQEHEKMSLIRSGQMKSEQLKETCLKLLDVASTKHIRSLLSRYVTRKRTMTIEEKQHVAECRKALSDMQKNTNHQIDCYIEEIQYNHDEASTSTLTMQNIFRQTDKLVKCQTSGTTQEMVTIPYDNRSVSPAQENFTYNKFIAHPHPDNTSSWYASAQQVSYEILDKQIGVPEQQVTPTITETYIIEQPTTSTQESISYSDEIEQMPSNELAFILQGIGYEHEGSKDQILLQHYLIQLAKDLQPEPNTIEQNISKQEEEHTQISQPITQTTTINTHTNEPTHNDEGPPIHEDFADITDLAERLSNEDFSQLADTLEVAMPLQEISPEEFFDFSNIDTK